MAAPRREVESVWDYPRPAVLVPCTGDELRVVFNGVEIGKTTNGYRALETSHPPTYYIPLEDIQTQYLQEIPGAASHCEWKGRAKYYDLVVNGKTSSRAVWHYPNPTTKVVPQAHGWKDFGSGSATGLGGSFGPIANMVSFYASKVDECYVNGERVVAQQGDYYGGWITSWISDGGRGIKGGPGTQGW
eukprot:CAMPEP_0197623804 /NCGR_PEP_ID=MMETSP1338-20131121/3728_1 /TAXON_ID=43686 ORGANISM="Pelagodinium beii, Strain RCC1491" /NCGR_SAMPLE_ID=MMETSP1338 /ASSEMBLY_ACC=CAM_ASM_000754 /LENGTH=187 /DNA_ID=CAMNT_0043193883 /DNA_START=93 /DNA_END=656 /DNA_ORIENTATION=-